MAVLKRGHQASTHSAKSNTHAKGLGRHRHKLNCCVGNGKFSLETIFIFLAFFVAGSFLFIHHIVGNNANKIDTTSSGEKLKRDFLRSTGKSSGINDADADFTNDGNPRADLTAPIAADNEFSPETRREHEQLKRDFLQSTGRQEDNLAMTIITKSDTGTTCSCDIVSADCLDSVNCLPEQATSLRNVATGILLRRLIKKTAKFEGPSLVKDSRCPVGKGFQYKTINAWLSWVNNNELPLQHDPSPTHIFFKNAKHKYCADNSLVSFQCYFTSINEQEEFDTLEAEALPYLDDLLKTNQESEQKIIRQMQDIQAAVSKDKGNEINALDHLRMMAHILRMLFNRQVPLRELSSMTRSFNANENEESQKQLVSPPLRVSIHIRRADACMANGKLVKEASPLDSSAQQFALRICYATSVYMDALQRLKDIHTKRDPTRRIEVFVSSDDASSLMDEIRDQFADLYKSMTWRIHDVDRERFNYKGFVEGYDHKNHNLLGEAAAADLWLLSNGEVFIGHLGSRFGKVAYLLATARHNRFIPFFSVDGHSVCCEIDEPCGEMKPYITSMSDCLTFSHDLVQGRGHVLNKDYFEKEKSEKEKNQKRYISNTVAADNTDSTNNDNPWADLTAPVADYEYFPETRRDQSVEEPVFQLDQSKCSSLVIDTSPPKLHPQSSGACDGFDGVLHIQQGDFGGASGTIFFLFVLGQLQYAEQFNLKPWVHLNSWSKMVYDQVVHGQGSKRKFTMMDGMSIGWARDARDVDGNLFPGRPRLRPDQNQLQQHESSSKVQAYGTITFCLSGIHSQSPWAPMAWRVGDIEYIFRRDLDFDVWFEPKRRNAAKLAKN